MNCDKNLLKPPPHDLVGKYDYGISPPRADLSDLDTFENQRHSIDSLVGKRETYMLCGMASALNEALRHHKQLACGVSANLNETYTVYDDPTDF
jgi:hypothetical protein